jgi:hypothetical protein
VPADAFYEWKGVEGGKQPYAIARRDGQPLAFAGLWESFRWPDETMTRSFTILTTAPNAEMAELHDRMPVVLERDDWPMWLGEAEGDHAALLRAAADGLPRVWPVGASAHRVGDCPHGRVCATPERLDPRRQTHDADDKPGRVPDPATCPQLQPSADHPTDRSEHSAGVSSRSLIWITAITRRPERRDDSLSQ